jgi:hypothetical protein
MTGEVASAADKLLRRVNKISKKKQRNPQLWQFLEQPKAYRMKLAGTRACAE